MLLVYLIAIQYGISNVAVPQKFIKWILVQDKISTFASLLYSYNGLSFKKEIMVHYYVKLNFTFIFILCTVMSKVFNIHISKQNYANFPCPFFGKMLKGEMKWKYIKLFSHKHLKPFLSDNSAPHWSLCFPLMFRQYFSASTITKRKVL